MKTASTSVVSTFRWQFFVQLFLICIAVLALALLFFWSFDNYVNVLFGILIGLFPFLLLRNVKVIEVGEKGIKFRYIFTGRKNFVPFSEIKSSRMFYTRIYHKGGRTDPVENFEFKTADGSQHSFSRSDYSNYSQLKMTIYKRMKIIKQRA